MYTHPYIPRADRHFRTWAEVFVRTIANDPARYMVAPAEAQWLTGLFDVFAEAFNRASNPATKTRSAIINKQDARWTLENACRVQAGFIKLNLGISDGDKINVGVPPINPRRTRRRCTAQPPLLDYLGGEIGSDVLCYSATETPESKAKPSGAKHLELYVAYSLPGEPTPKPSEAKYVGPFTKSPFRVAHDDAEETRGARPTYYARWRGYRSGPDDVSAWSLAVSLAIAKQKMAEAAKQVPSNQVGDQNLKLAA